MMDILTLLNEVQGLARTGLHFATNAYDRERYQHLIKLAAQSYDELFDVPETEQISRFAGEMGYITPKIGADAAIFNEDGEILLMDRIDGSGWCLPCGWVEVNERPVDAVVREVWEETGLRVKVKQLVGVFTRKASLKNGPHTMVAVVHLCEIADGKLTLSPEGSALKYWSIDAVNKWHPNHDKYARAAYEMWQSDKLLPAISD
jgi:ADP-ribose pyrophosphatase YjhB (NUDIX family)